MCSTWMLVAGVANASEGLQHGWLAGFVSFFSVWMAICTSLPHIVGSRCPSNSPYRTSEGLPFAEHAFCDEPGSITRYRKGTSRMLGLQTGGEQGARCQGIL